MAELLLKVGTVGPDPAYQDGDIVCAFSRYRIECCHAQTICWARGIDGAKPVDRFGFRLDPLGLAEELSQRSYRYRFDRISQTEVVRTDLVLGSQETFGPPDIDVPLFLRRRLDHCKSSETKGGGKIILGAPGSERWYGGSRVMDPPGLDAVWQAIEGQTGRLRADHQRWPLSRIERRHFLAVSCDDMSEDDVTTLMAPELVRMRSSEVVPLRKRRHRVPWRGLNLAALGTTESNVDDRDREIDIRGPQLLRATIVLRKS